MPRLEISLFGPPEALLDGAPFDTERRKAFALLAYLAVLGEDQPREQLAALLWPDYDRASALAYLRRELYEISSNLGKTWLKTDRRLAGLLFGPDLMVDVRTFEAHLAASKHTDDPLPHLTEAAAHYRGDFLSGFYLADTPAFEDWQRGQAETYRRDYAAVLERLASIHEQQGEWDAALDRSHAWLALDTLNETAHRALMRIYADMGNRSRAVRQYEECRAALDLALSVEPQPETTALYERILHGDFHVGPAPSENPVQPPPPGPVRLPVLTTPFIGRRPEVEQVKELIGQPDTRLLTLLGPGGTGKTRLAIQAAGEIADRFTDGVCFVPLAPVAQTEGIIPEIASALKFSFYREDEAPRRQLVDYLREKKLLLILDNLEQLVSPETAALLVEILTEAASVKLVVTTRERLNVQAEKLFVVTGMRMPTADEAAAWKDPLTQAMPYSAIQLFLDRAARVQQGFQLNRNNARAVTDICILVNGLPLGLELAASWLELLPPEEIAAEIRRSMDFLATDQPDVPERQRSLRVVFDYSWKLLNDIEKDVFLRLNVFEGSFSRDAAQAVTGGSLRTFLSLTNKSWLQQGEEGRFQLHPLLGIYGRERLQADERMWHEVRERHAAFFAEFMFEQGRRLQGAEQLDALNSISREYATNVRAAWDWLMDAERWDVILDKMTHTVFQFAQMRWRGESMVEWFRAARKRLDGDERRDHLLAFAVLGTIEVYLEETWSIKEHQPLKRLVRIWKLVEEEGLDEAMGFWFIVLGTVHRERSFTPDTVYRVAAATERIRQDPDRWFHNVAILFQSNYWGGLLGAKTDQVRLLREEVLPFFKSAGAIYEQGVILQFLADNAAAELRPIDEVVDLYLQAQDKFLELEDRYGFGMMYWQWANQYFAIGQTEKGFEGYDRMQAVFEELGHQGLVGMVMAWRALWMVRYRTYEQALATRHRSLIHNQKFGFDTSAIWDEYEMAEIYRIFGRFKEARQLYESARMEIERLDLVLGKGYLERAYGDMEFSAGRYEETLAHYRSYLDFVIRDNHIWSIVQANGRIAWALAHLGLPSEARREIRAVLERLIDTAEDGLIMGAMLAESRCLIFEGAFAEAAALAGFVVDNPITWNEIRDHGRAILGELAGKLPEEVMDAETARYADLTARDLAEAWLSRFPARGNP